MALRDKVLRFWFPYDATKVIKAPPEATKLWFGQGMSKEESAKLDSDIKDQFEQDWIDVVEKGEHRDLLNEPLGTLSLIILTDQFPRNMFRNTAKSFASDPLALSFAKHAVEKKFDKALPHSQKLFIALPFMHSENLQDQDTCISMLKENVAQLPEADKQSGENLVQFGLWHREIIEKFGRFPHRNAPLGRTPTPEEVEYLEKGGRRF